MGKFEDNFPYRPGDKVQITDISSDYFGQTFYVGATGWVMTKPVVWLRGNNPPLNPIEITGVIKVDE